MQRVFNDSGNLRSDSPKIREITTYNMRHLKSLPMGVFNALLRWIYKAMISSLSKVKEVFR